MLMFPESVESVQSQVRVSKPALVPAIDVDKQCTATSQTNGFTFAPQESTLRSQLMSSEPVFAGETESAPAKS